MSNPLTIADAAQLGVTRWRVNALIPDGRLKATRVGQVFPIDERNLKAVADRTPGRPPKVRAKVSPTGEKLKRAAKKGGKK